MRFAVSLAAMFVAAQPLASPSLVGVWDFPAIQFDTATPAAVTVVHSEPSVSAPVIATLDGRGITFAGAATPSCLWNRDLERPAAPRGCSLTESGYEIATIGVFEKRGEWLRIALDDNATEFGWLQPSGEFHALADLLAADHLTYLTARWDRMMFDSPGRVRPRAARLGSDSSAATPEISYRAIDHVFVDDRLWLHVELLDRVCRVAEPVALDRGWVPAQSAAGEQWTWFWSRGC
jgi:hypothetical protein